MITNTSRVPEGESVKPLLYRGRLGIRPLPQLRMFDLDIREKDILNKLASKVAVDKIVLHMHNIVLDILCPVHAGLRMRLGCSAENT